MSELIKLNTVERGELRKLEIVIEKGVESFLATGEALKQIRDELLYKESYKSFDSYLKGRWAFDRSRAYQLIDASDVSKKCLPLVHNFPKVTEINNERQLRELASVPKESFEAVIEKAVEIAGEGKITARIIQQAKVETLETEWVDVDDEAEPPATKSKITLPPKIAQALENGKYHQQFLVGINALLRLLDAIPELPGTDLLLSRRLSMRREIEGLKGKVLLAKPHAMCPRCKGESCPQCGNYGWVSSAVYRELTK